MQEFFMDYGLWLLIALLIVIAVVFLLGARRKAADLPPPAESPAPIERTESAPIVTAPPVPPPATIAPAAPEPIEAAAPFVAPAPDLAPAAPIPVSPAVTVPAGQSDDLLRLKGVGPKLNQLLIELGVTRYAQIAAWSDADIAQIDTRLGNFRGRPVRDQWVDQAKYLAAGDIAGFESKYGKL
ncbi:MAG TPA: hypothetical protein VJM09_14510 [Sphingobium sp.]|nr:hypothetical protein [Sphingobium sp.]